MHRFFQTRIPNCLKSWRSAKPSYGPQLPKWRSPRRPHLVTLVPIEKNDIYQLVFGMHANLTINFADDPGVNPEVVRGDKQHANR